MLRVCAGLEELGRVAAEEVAQAAAASIADRGRFALALSGGETPRGLYRLLAAPPWREKVDWARVELFWGDERAVPPGDPGSNYRLAEAELIRPLAIPAGRVHRIPAERGAAAAAEEYERELARVLGAEAGGPPPPLDLVLLGMGPDGHVASLFPGSAALAERRRWVVAAAGPSPWPERVTLTGPALAAARRLLVLVAGAGKAEALAAVLRGPPEPERLPAQLLLGLGERVRWLVDGAAAARLEAGGARARS